MRYDENIREQINTLVEKTSSLLREQTDHESVSELEHELIARIQYASAIVQAEKVTPPEGWDPLGR